MTASKENQTFYDVLHVQPSAPPPIIKNAYRALMLSMKQHPDLGGDTEQAALINRAYDVLRDRTKRAEYDEFLANQGSVDEPSNPEYQNETAEPTEDHAGENKEPIQEIVKGSCPFCAAVYGHSISACSSGTYPNCVGCGSPTESPAANFTNVDETRRIERYTRNLALSIQLSVGADELIGQLLDLSPNGLGFSLNSNLPERKVVRISCSLFEALAEIAYKRQISKHTYNFGAQFLTLRLRRTTGTFISTKL